MATPRTSVPLGNCILPKSSLTTFLFPNLVFHLLAVAVTVVSSVSVKNTMFFSRFGDGRAVEPNCEGPRVIWLWVDGHWIPVSLPSCEIQMTRLVLPHSGHLTVSPILGNLEASSFLGVCVSLCSMYLSHGAVKPRG